MRALAWRYIRGVSRGRDDFEQPLYPLMGLGYLKDLDRDLLKMPSSRPASALSTSDAGQLSGRTPQCGSYGTSEE